MKKMAAIIAINMLALGLVLSGAFAADMTAQKSASTQWASSLIGATVKNLQGDTLGKITDLTISDDRVTFAVVSQGGMLGIGDRLIPVPMSALSIKEGNVAILDISKEKFASAPNYENKKTPDFSNRQWTEDTYKFYGVQPFWKGSMEHMK